MSEHEATLAGLVSELCSEAELEALEAVFTPEFDHRALIYLDLLIGGPGIATIQAANLGPQDLPDRDIFRPLQYCEAYFLMFNYTSWATRSVVQMSGLHLESLSKRVGSGRINAPLGQLLWKNRITRVLDATTVNQLRRFAQLYNAAKHDLLTDEDRHLFSQRDAVQAYVVSRKLAKALYPHAKLTVGLKRFANAKTNNEVNI